MADKVIDYVTIYAKDVVAGKKESVCKAELAACKRHLADLKRKDLAWHPEIAEKHIRYAEMLKVYDDNEKQWKPLKLRGFQKFIIGSIFGWYKNGIRRYSEAYIQIARKNGKSFLNAFFCLDFATLAGIQNGQICCAGTVYANAAIVWNDLKKMISADSQLEEFFGVHDYRDSRSYIINKKNGSTIIPLAGGTEGKQGKDGMKILFASLDEYHNHETDEMYNVLHDSQVGLNNAAIIAITTAGKNLNSPCYQQYKYAKAVVTGAMEADNLFVYICEIDLPDSHKHPVEYEKELWNPQNWAMANPFLLYDDDYHVTKDAAKWQKFLAKGEKAKAVEGTVLNDFLIKHLNCWTTVGTTAYCDVTDLQQCTSTKTLEYFKGMNVKVYFGLDLSSKNDLASLSGVIPVQDNVEKMYIFSHSFMPKAQLEKRKRKDKLPYDRFIQLGNLTLTDNGGKNEFVLDTQFILEYARKLIEEYNFVPVYLGYDPMGISGVYSQLEEVFAGAELVEVGQYPKSMNDATRDFQGRVQGHEIEYDVKNELLTTSFNNAETVLTAKQLMIIDKKGGMAKHKIDAIDAVLNAYKCYLADDSAVSQAEADNDTADSWLALMEKL